MVSTTSLPTESRGMVESVAVPGDGRGAARYEYARFAIAQRPFWKPIIAGSLFALSVLALSWYLMLGCHVGVASGGIVALGAGAAVWMWITACIAFFFGGMIARGMSLQPVSAWLKGAVIWALSIPLGLLILSAVANSGLSLAAVGLPHTGIIGNVGVAGVSYGFVWSAFIFLLCGLVFSLIGSATGCSCMSDETRIGPDSH